MRVLEVALIGTVVMGGVSGIAALFFAIDLWRKTWSIPGLPLNVRLNPFNIVAYRELWTPAVAAANRRLMLAVMSMIGLALLSGFIALMRI